MHEPTLKPLNRSEKTQIAQNEQLSSTYPYSQKLKIQKRERDWGLLGELG